MAIRWAVTGGTWSSTSTWNDGATLGIPTVGDDVYTNGFIVTVNTGFTVNSLNNTARARDIATPVMTSNNTPSPYVVAASSQRPGEDPFLAFNRNYTTTQNFGLAVPTGWLSMDFGSSIIIDGYTIYGSSQQLYNPRNWTFEGSNNNTSWDILHTVTSATAIPTNGTYSISSIGNPTGYRYYRLNITANGGGPETTRITELELYQPFTAALAAGGSFNFNTSGVTANITGTAPLVAGATNLIQITASLGTITINLGGNVSIGITLSNLINITGNCNVVLSGGYEFQVGTGNISCTCINKTGNGNIIITGTLRPGNSNSSTTQSLNISSGTATINGNVIGGNGITAANRGIVATTNAVIVVNGNVIGGAGTGSGNFGISAAGVQVTINGNVTGGFATPAVGTDSVLYVNGNVTGGSSSNVNSLGILTSGAITIINGSVTATLQPAISSSSANIINVTGTVSASATANAISMTNANGQVYLNGNMFNVNGKMAIYAPIVWLDQTGTTQSRFFTSGGADRTLYSDNTFPNLPSTSNVRQGVGFSPSSGLTGTIIIPSNTDVRSGVIYDNGTVGTALFDTSQLLAELNASSNPIAQRLRKVATPEILGQLLAAYKK